MAKEKLPKQYLQIKKRHEKYFNAVEERVSRLKS